MCPAETPEGASVGVVKNLSYMSHITIPSNSGPIHEYVLPHIIPLSELPATELDKYVKVFVNGAWLGVSKDPVTLYRGFQEKKHKGITQ